MTSFHSYTFTLELQSVKEFSIVKKQKQKQNKKRNQNTFLKKTQNNGGTWNRIRNHIFRKEESLLRILSSWVWGGLARGAVCSSKNTIGATSRAHTLQSFLSALCLYTHKHTHRVQALYMSANTITHWHGYNLEIQQNTHSGVLAGC